MAEFIGTAAGPVLDLGAGGGVPGLVLAECWPDQLITLLDTMHRRCEFLARAVTDLAVEDRVTVVEGRAESLAHEPSHREAYGLVVARSFGSPAVTGESAAGFLRAGGRLVVSEPPEGEAERWPAAGLSLLGLKKTGAGRVRGAGFVELARQGRLDPRWPRRTGVPTKRPLW
jgi:16S rRNA (guanine527-N7)-methyltransferase